MALPVMRQMICVTHTHSHTSPVDGRGSSMAGEKGGVIDDGAMFWVVNHLHWDELRAEWKYVQVCLD